MQFARALKFPLRDADWFKKILLVAVCQFLPLLGLFVATGWALEISRRVIRKREDELPELSFRRNLSDGFAVWLIFLLYEIPVYLWLILGGIFTALWVLRLEEGARVAFDALWWGIEIVALLMAFGMAVWATAAVGRFADTGNLRAAFRLRDVFSLIRAAPVPFLMVVLGWIPLGLIAGLGVVICCAGVFFTGGYAAAAVFHLAGQAYTLAAARFVAPAGSST